MTLPFSDLTLWLLVIAIAVGTFLLRLSFIHFSDRMTLPPLVQRALRFVPPAVLAALILPALLRSGGSIDLTLANPRWIAGLLAAVIAWRTHNVLLTLATGMGTLWLLQALL